jgi:hypothetical protein
MTPELTARLARQNDENERQDALTIASRLMTGREDPHIVLPVADYLLTWMRADGLPGAAEIRCRAMIRHLHNISEGFSGPGVTAFENDPDGFLAAAAQYVPFLTADETAP